VKVIERPELLSGLERVVQQEIASLIAKHQAKAEERQASTPKNVSSGTGLWGCSIWNNSYLTTNMTMFNSTNIKEEL
jgi:hypothetical protein